ncbi:hypothetical protein [Haloechinothrix salitolerans]|uniref:Uncharacterized protein n=1 Tax=Haloechinothrix salitolerans TaxID=926830 RepID=A0ABW2BXR7_9PSEU
MRRFSRLAAAAGIPVAAALVFMPGAATGTERVPAVPDPTPALSATAPTATIIDRKQLANGATETTVRMGPIVAQPHSNDGGEHGHGTHTTLAGPWQPPCVNCYVTSVKPDLTYADGSSANYDTGVMLHHAVLFDRSKQDVTCGDSDSFYELTGRRIFASGNERTGGKLPDGYGIKFGAVPMTWGVVELMNMKPEPQAVFVEATITHVPADPQGMEEVTPIWLDAANCTGDSQHSVPAGESTTTWRWQSTISGTVKAAGGHLHDGGRSLALSNASTGQHMCTSKAGYGTDPAYMGHIESMSLCTGQDLGTVRRGQVLQLDSKYQMDHAADDVMTIMIAYVDEEA